MDAPEIISDPKIMMGKPVIKGTRITVELILEELAAGYTDDDILTSHPHINHDAILASLKYASKAIRTPRRRYKLAS